MHQRSLLAYLGWLYVALIGLWLVLRAIFFDQIWWLALLNTFAIYLFVPLPLLLLFSLWRRRWALVFGLALPTAIFFALFGTLILPKPTSVPEDASSITVMTFNVLTSNKDTDALVAAVRAAQPDILGLEELTDKKRAALHAAFGDQMPNSTFAHPGFGNVGLITHFPIDSVQSLTMPSGQPALHAQLNIHGQRVHTFVAHLSPNHLFKNPALSLAEATSEAFARRAAEVAFLQEKIRDLREPALLLCDCNLTDTSQAHAQLAAFLTDSFREVGWGLRNTNGAGSIPLQRIDYVWHSAGLVAISTELGQAGGSDHLPVIVRLHVEKGSGAFALNHRCRIPT